MLQTDWDSSQFDWLLLMAQLRLYNNDILISEWVGPDIKNSNEYVIQVSSECMLLLSLFTHALFMAHYMGLQPINSKKQSLS
jgi:hypothetical protein